MSTLLPGFATPRSLASITPAQFATLFSGEDAPEMAYRPRGGLWRATLDFWATACARWRIHPKCGPPRAPCAYGT